MGRATSTCGVVLLLVAILAHPTGTTQVNWSQGEVIGETNKVPRTKYTVRSSTLRPQKLRLAKDYSSLKPRVQSLKHFRTVNDKGIVITQKPCDKDSEILRLLITRAAHVLSRKSNGKTKHDRSSYAYKPNLDPWYNFVETDRQRRKEKRLKSREIVGKSERKRREAKPESPSSSLQQTVAPKTEPESSIPEPESPKRSDSEPEPNAEASWPEPGPNWPVAFKKWEWAWGLHVYGFATLFILLSLVPILQLFRLHVSKSRKTTLKVTLLIMVVVFSVTRAIALYVNPYGSTGRLDATLTRLLFTIGNPCAISALSLLLLVLIDTTKMDVAPPRFQRLRYITPVILVHVILVIVTDLIVANYLSAKYLLLVCQLYFIIVGALLTVGFAKVLYKISQNVTANIHRDRKMRRLQIMISVSTVVCGTLLTLHIYAAFGVFGIYSDVKYVDAWPWWGFQTCQRILEIAMCLIVVQLNSNTIERRGTLLRLLPCYKNNQIEPFVTNTNYSATFRISSVATSIPDYKRTFRSEATLHA